MFLMASFFIMKMWPFDWMTIDIFDPQPRLFHQLHWIVEAGSLKWWYSLNPVSGGHVTSSYHMFL